MPKLNAYKVRVHQRKFLQAIYRCVVVFGEVIFFSSDHLKHGNVSTLSLSHYPAIVSHFFFSHIFDILSSSLSFFWQYVLYDEWQIDKSLTVEMSVTC